MAIKDMLVDELRQAYVAETEESTTIHRWRPDIDMLLKKPHQGSSVPF